MFLINVECLFSADVAALVALAAGNVALMCCTSNLYIARVSAHVALAARIFKTFLFNEKKEKNSRNPANMVT